MAGKWTVTYTDEHGRGSTKTAASVSEFASKVRDVLGNIRVSNVSAVLPDGTKLNEAT